MVSGGTSAVMDLRWASGRPREGDRRWGSAGEPTRLRESTGHAERDGTLVPALLRIGCPQARVTAVVTHIRAASRPSRELAKHPRSAPPEHRRRAVPATGGRYCSSKGARSSLRSVYSQAGSRRESPMGTAQLPRSRAAGQARRVRLTPGWSRAAAGLAAGAWLLAMVAARSAWLLLRLCPVPTLVGVELGDD